jgi:ketosteroid isomerase-like protein
MSRESVEAVRRGFEVINGGELRAILALVDDITDPEVEVRAVGRLPDASRVLHGREAAKAFWTQLLDSFDWRFEAEEFIDAGDAVVVVTRQVARGRGSGAEVTNRIVSLFRFREGKVTHIDAYRTRAEALEAAGLRE